MKPFFPILPASLARLFSVEDLEFPGGDKIVRRWRLPVRFTQEEIDAACEAVTDWRTAAEPASEPEILDILRGLSLHYLDGQRTRADFDRLIDDFIASSFGWSAVAIDAACTEWRTTMTRWPALPEYRGKVGIYQEDVERTLWRIELIALVVQQYAGECPTVRDMNGEPVGLLVPEVRDLALGAGALEGRNIEWPQHVASAAPTKH